MKEFTPPQLFLLYAPLLILLAFLLACGPADSTPDSDRAALVALYNATDGPNWSNNRYWLSDVPIDDWHGVATDAAGRVTGLRLNDNQLSGEIPTELGNLSNLEWLSLRGNRITGCLPRDLLGNFPLWHDWEWC